MIPDLDTPDCEHQKCSESSWTFSNCDTIRQIWSFEPLIWRLAELVCFFVFTQVPWRCFFFFASFSLFVYPSPNRELSTPAALWVRKGQHAKGSFLCPVSSVNPDWPAGWEESQGYNNATCSCWLLHKQGGKKRERKKKISKWKCHFSQHCGFAFATGHLCIKGSLKANNRRWLGCQAEPALFFLSSSILGSTLKHLRHETEQRGKTDRCLRSIWRLRKHQIWNGVWSNPYGDSFFPSSSSSLSLYISDRGRIDLTSTEPAAWSSSISLPMSDGNNWMAVLSPPLN